MLSKKRLFSRIAQDSQLGELTPQFRLGPGSAKVQAGDLLMRFPFNRHWGIIAVVALVFVVLTLTLVSVGIAMISSGDGSLFTLLFNVFILLWLLGWSLAVVVVGLLLLLLVLGRETLHASRHSLNFTIGIPGVSFGVEYQATALRNFCFRSADADPGSSWRGDHLCFDYATRHIGFGSNINPEQGRQIIKQLQGLYAQHGLDAPAPNVLLSAHRSDQLHALTATMTTLPEPTQGVIDSRSAVSWTSPSTLFLLLANLIPVAGVLFLNWEIAEVMLLFWAESGIIGFYNLLKMWKIGGIAVLGTGPFFIAHFGGFMAVHLMFIYGIFIDGMVTMPASETTTTGRMLADMMALAPALIGYFISHGVSYSSNFIGKQEYLERSVSQQMGEPYKRIIIMHMTIIIGGFLVMALNSSMPALLLLIGAKLASDILSHLKEHRPKAMAA